MTRNIDNNEDMLDVRDIIARVEELDAIHDELFDKAHEDPATKKESEAAYDNWIAEEGGESAERATLRTLLDDLKGNGGDERWEGDWYPVTLIRDSYFEDAMDELLEDIGDLPKDLPCYLKITVDYKALQMDYTSCEFEGVTYWYR